MTPEERQMAEVVRKLYERDHWRAMRDVSPDVAAQDIVQEWVAQGGSILAAQEAAPPDTGWPPTPRSKAACGDCGDPWCEGPKS